MNPVRPPYFSTRETPSKRVVWGAAVKAEVPVLVKADEEEPVPKAPQSKGKRKVLGWT